MNLPKKLNIVNLTLVYFTSLSTQIFTVVSNEGREANFPDPGRRLSLL
jgi:hypothetical protein